MKSNPPSLRGARALALAALASLFLFPALPSAQTGQQPAQQPQTPQGMGVSTGTGLVSATRRTTGITDPKAPLVFEDVTARTALAQFRHQAGGRQKDYIVETTSGGVAVFDFDNDGQPDIYLLNGSTMGVERGKE